MNYDVIGIHDHDYFHGYSFEEILSVLEGHFTTATVVFVGTNYSFDRICSWRGAYAIPAILVSEEPKTVRECIEIITEGLEQTHEGYKGGEYEYEMADTPFITTCPSKSDEYKIVGFEYNTEENKLVFLTRYISF